MGSEEGQKHIYAQELQLYYYYNNFKALLAFNFNFVFQKKQLHLRWLDAVFKKLSYSLLNTFNFCAVKFK